MVKSLNAAGAFRAVLATFYCFAALMVFFHLSHINHWGNWRVRVPIFALVPWGYMSKWKNRAVMVLSAVSFLSLSGAFLFVMFPTLQGAWGTPAEKVLGTVALASLVAALGIHAWVSFWDSRAVRKRLRASSRSPLERLSGGFG